jgi:hypothetical protein
MPAGFNPPARHSPIAGASGFPDIFFIKGHFPTR